MELLDKMNEPPLTLKYRPRRFEDVVGQVVPRLVLQRMLQTNTVRPVLLFFGSFGNGKAQPLNAQVLTPTGFRTMGDLKIGDPVIDPEGQPSEVTGIFPQGVQDIYRVTFSDGSSCECTADHLWPVCRPRSRRHQGNSSKEVCTLKDIPRYALRHGGDSSWTLAAELRSDLDFVDGNIPLDPYVVGLLLGGGHLPLNGSVLFGSADAELIDACRQGVSTLGVTLVQTDVKRSNAARWFRLSDSECEDGVRQSVVRSILGLLGMLVSSNQKFVPEMYKISSAKTRLAVLRGILDMDGSARPGGAELSSASYQLCKDVQWLARSLGFRASEVGSVSHNYWNDQHQEQIVAKDHHRVLIYRSPEMPELFNLTRKQVKACRLNARLGMASRRFVSVEFVRRAEAQCISVSAPSSLYVTDDFIPTHNTTLARIFAAALNCEKDDVSARPCGRCAPCEAVAAGHSADVIEVDAASSGLVDDVRKLRQSLQFASAARYRAMILDEAHELTDRGFQTLLKTLEEPPENTIFILVTTERDRVPDTIQSRCLSLEFRKLTSVQIRARLRQIADAEGLTEQGLAPEELLTAIAERANGAARDAVGLLDQARLVGVRSSAQLAALLGEVDHGVRVLTALAPDGAGTVDYPAAFVAVSEALRSAPRAAVVVGSVVAALRVLLAGQGDTAPMTGGLAELALRIPPQRAAYAMRVIWDFYARVGGVAEGQAGLDLLVVRLGEALAGSATPGASVRGTS